MARQQIFEAIRASREDKRFSIDEVGRIDYLLDQLGVPRMTGVEQPMLHLPDDYWPLLAKIESGNRPYIKAPTSSGSGLYQFVRATWEGEGGKWGSNMGLAFGGLTPTPEEQTLRAKTFTAKNAAILQAKGVQINRSSLYAAHFLGAVTAAKVINSDVKARADEIAGAAATNANPSILRNKTVGEFLAWLHGKTGDWAR